MATAQRTNMGVNLSGSEKWRGITAGPDGKLYCAPYNATDILVIDPVAGTATRTNMGADLSGTDKWRGIAAGPDGKLYCAPYDATNILVIDPVAGTATRTNMEVGLSGILKWCGTATGPAGKLYCAPYNATDILVISPVFLLGLYFKDELGYLSIPGVGILRRLNVGDVIQGTRSGHKVVKVENRTGVAIQNVV